MNNKKFVLISGCWISRFSGYGNKAYDIVKSIIELKKDEWNIVLYSLNWGGTKSIAIPEFEPYYLKSNRIETQPDLYIHIGLPSEMTLQGKKNILFTSGIETNLIPFKWIEGGNKYDELVVPSEFTKAVFEQSAYETRDPDGNVAQSIKLQRPVSVLFEGIDENRLKPTKIDLMHIKEQFAFLFTGVWLPGAMGQDRKDVGSLIRVFLETFKGTVNPPALILKTNGGNSSIIDRNEILKKIDEVRKLVTGALPNIYLLHGDLSDGEMAALYNHPKVKAMVSFTRGEGFSRTFLEFAVTGKPVITTGYSGHIDFLHPDEHVLLPSKLEPVHPSVVNEWIVRESQWRTVDYGMASHALKEVHKNYKTYADRSNRAKNRLRKSFSIDFMKVKLGEMLNKWLPKQTEIIIPDYSLFETDLSGVID